MYVGSSNDSLTTNLRHCFPVRNWLKDVGDEVELKGDMASKLTWHGVYSNDGLTLVEMQITPLVSNLND